MICILGVIFIFQDAFKNFRCLRLYELDPARPFSAAGLAWQAALKETEVKLELLTDINMVLMVE